MEGTIEQGSLRVNYQEAGQHAIRQRFAQTFFDRRNIFAGNRAALDRIDEFETFTRFAWLQLDPHVAILTAAAGLLDELAFDFDRFPDRFAVSHLRRANVGFYADLAFHTVDQNFQVQLAHAGHDRLTRLFIGTNTKR